MTADAVHDEPCTVLQWDTEFWGYPIASLNKAVLTPAALTAMNRWCLQHEIRCLYHRTAGTEPTTLALLAESGFRFIDVRVDLQKDVSHQTASATSAQQWRIRDARAADLSRLQSLASEAHRDTRFRKDLMFDQSKARELYARWLQRDFKEHHVLVSESEHGSRDVVGYVTCQKTSDQSRGRIGLIGVESRQRGHDIARLLVDAALAWFSKTGVTSVAVSTQATNVAAMRLYESNGFKTHEVSIWYHKWFHS